MVPPATAAVTADQMEGTMLEFERMHRFGDDIIDSGSRRSDRARPRLDEMRQLHMSAPEKPASVLPTFGAVLVVVSLAAMCVL
jgi:hypothetical protein